jgi:predicted MFS family arabinose efflux permease
VPILGTKRKSYVVLMGYVEFFSLISIYLFEIKHGLSVAMLLGVTSLCLAFINVVVDAIMCIQARKDPEHGSQDLMSIAWMAQGIGGVAGCVLGGYMTENGTTKYSYLIMSIMGLVLALNGMLLSKECERDDQEESSEGFWAKLKLNLG